ncbi:hypothetical protein LXL04_031493 [Taraxacum kok-saghyz]
MAEVSYLHHHQVDDDGEYDDRDEVMVSLSSHNNWSHGVDAFDVYPSDLDCPSFDDFFCQTDRTNDSVLFDREYQVNFVIDMFHQSVEQSQPQSQSYLAVENSFRNSDRSARGGFMLADCGDDFIVPRRTTGDVSSPEHFMVPDLGSDSIVDGENTIDFLIDDESNVFQLEDGNEIGENSTNPNDDFEWEEVDDLNMIFESEADDDIHRDEIEEQPHQWEVLLNIHNLEPGTYDDESNYTEYGMFVDVSSLGRPPASITVVNNLSSVVITPEDYEKNNTGCAVCKDEITVGLVAKQLPCSHRYHTDCILPWLAIRNTCPVCRHELLTDDPEYELMKAERGGGDQ